MVEVISMEEIKLRASLLGVDFSTFDLDSIHLPPGEDFGIIRYKNPQFATFHSFVLKKIIDLCFCGCSDDEDIKEEERLEFESGHGNIIVVDNLPVVPKEKFEKLETVVRKIYSQIGKITDDGLWMPVDPDTQKTLGYCFVEYSTPQVPFFSFIQI